MDGYFSARVQDEAQLPNTRMGFEARANFTAYSRAIPPLSLWMSRAWAGDDNKRAATTARAARSMVRVLVWAECLGLEESPNANYTYSRMSGMSRSSRMSRTPPEKKYAKGGPTFEMRVDPEFLELVDEWRRMEPDMPSRAEAIRRIVAAYIKGKKR